jgi:aprataxin
MHIISEDYHSEKMKTKKHWNSFTTKCFVPGDELMKMLKENEKVEFDQEELHKIEDMDISYESQKHKNMKSLKNILKINWEKKTFKN